MFGAEGNDWLSGDRDNDTLTGGSGADRFHTFADSGVDRVMDFNRAEGDQVELLPGALAATTFSQVGADVVIESGAGGQLILVGVQLLSLGLVADVVGRTYHEAQGKRTYKIREWLGGDAERQGARRDRSLAAR